MDVFTSAVVELDDLKFLCTIDTDTGWKCQGMTFSFRGEDARNETIYKHQ